jgi:hypothetical protein
MRQKNKTKRRSPKTVLRLPDLDHSKSSVLQTLGSVASQKTYAFAIDDFISWYCSEPRLASTRTAKRPWSSVAMIASPPPPPTPRSYPVKRMSLIILSHDVEEIKAQLPKDAAAADQHAKENLEATAKNTKLSKNLSCGQLSLSALQTYLNLYSVNSGEENLMHLPNKAFGVNYLLTIRPPISLVFAMGRVLQECAASSARLRIDYPR